jgi:hypothetical protein
MRAGTAARALIAVALAAGCAEETSESAESAGVGGEGGMQAPPDPYAHLYQCVETDFGDVHSLSGPGYDPETGIIGTSQDTYVVSTTLFYWKPEMTDEVYQTGGRVMGQISDSPGMVAYAVGTDETCLVARQLSVWRSEEDLYAFVLSGAHAEAIGSTLDVSLTGRGTHWTITADELATLDWDTARAKLDEVEMHPIYRAE